MSTNKSSESIKKAIEYHTETDKTQPKASSETSVIIKSDELVEEENKKGKKTFQ